MRTLIIVMLVSHSAFAAVSKNVCPYKNAKAPVRMHASTNPGKKASGTNNVIAKQTVNKTKSASR